MVLQLCGRVCRRLSFKNPSWKHEGFFVYSKFGILHLSLKYEKNPAIRFIAGFLFCNICLSVLLQVSVLEIEVFIVLYFSVLGVHGILNGPQYLQMQGKFCNGRLPMLLTYDK